jgi:sn-1 stearoyl-lipid 9-desaturase
MDRVLDPPSYGFLRDGKFYRPSEREILREFFSRLNIAVSRKNWLALFGWVTSLVFVIPLVLFFIYYFSWPLLLAGFIYSMVFLGSHGTVWLHRYSTHRAFRFSGPFARTLCRNLVLKIIPEEIYVVSHHVHHRQSEQPGDPYNVHGGWLYCFLADVNHQGVNKSFSSEDYAQLCRLVAHTGVRVNSYEQYLKWGSLCHPAWSIAHYAANWAFWYGAFFLLGGHALALALFGMSGVWAIGVRTYNYDGHGRGRDRRREGTDFHTRDWSINQMWPGYVAGEWHNNHHLYPSSARSGFLPHQLDLAWLFIRFYSWVGGIAHYYDSKRDFMESHYLPYLRSQQAPNAYVAD